MWRGRARVAGKQFKPQTTKDQRAVESVRHQNTVFVILATPEIISETFDLVGSVSLS